MKKISFTVALALTTLLSACGGGGGGHSFVPPSTLPDNPSGPTTPTVNIETNMTTESFSNAERREELYNKAKASTSSTFALFRSAPMTATSKADEISTTYNNMKKYLIDGNLSSATDTDLKKSLVLVGFNINELPNSGIGDWVKIHENEIKNKAQIIWDNYGVEKNISLENAKLTMVNIDSIQDSFVKFEVDGKGNIIGLNVYADTDQSDSRNMKLTRNGDGKFVHTGPSYIYGVNVDFDVIMNTENKNGWTNVRLELFEEPKDIKKLQNMLIAEIEEMYFPGKTPDETSEIIAKASEWIKTLTLDSFNGNTEETAQRGQAFHEGLANVKTTVEYKSYGKDVNSKGLQYADFGHVNIQSMEGNQTVNESFVFAGGLDAKRISKDKLVALNQPLTFEGKATAALLYQKYNETDDRTEFAKNVNGTANLTFDNGKETLVTDFSKEGWHKVTVTSNASNDNYNIKFDGNVNLKGLSPKENNDLYTYDTTSPIENFVGGTGPTYGAVDFGYYGENRTNPTEAAGYVEYGKSNYEESSERHVQIGFGAVKK